MKNLYIIFSGNQTEIMYYVFSGKYNEMPGRFIYSIHENENDAFTECKKLIKKIPTKNILAIIRITVNINTNTKDIKEIFNNLVSYEAEFKLIHPYSTTGKINLREYII